MKYREIIFNSKINKIIGIIYLKIEIQDPTVVVHTYYLSTREVEAGG